MRTARRWIEGGVANEKHRSTSPSFRARSSVLKGKDFKIEPADEVKVGDKPAVGIKVTAPDGKDFKLYFDKESGLPVKLVAEVVGFQGEEFTMETTYASYKEFDGIKKATKSRASATAKNSSFRGHRVQGSGQGARRYVR